MCQLSLKPSASSEGRGEAVVEYSYCDEQMRRMCGLKDAADGVAVACIHVGSEDARSTLWTSRVQEAVATINAACDDLCRCSGAVA